MMFPSPPGQDWGQILTVFSTVFSNRRDSDDSLSSSDIDDREREAKKRAKEEKNEKIREKISNYKKEEIIQIEKKYAISIEFKSTKVRIISKDTTLQNKIAKLKQETNELEESIKELKAIKNETFR